MWRCFHRVWKEVLSKLREGTGGGRRERQKTERWTDTQTDTHAQERQQES